MGAFELESKKNTDSIIYKGEGCDSKDISDGDTLTTVLDKLIDCNSLTPSDSTTYDFESIICAGVPSCLVGVSYSPVDWSLSESLGFSYDLSDFILSLGSDFSLVRSKVQVYSDQSIFSSTDLVSGFTTELSQLPAFVDVDVVMNSLCGLIKFTASFVLTCNGTGTFQTTLTPKGGGDITISSQSDFNSFIKGEVENVKNELTTKLTSLKLPVSDLFPTNYMSQKSSIFVLADTAIKLDARLKEVESVKGCGSTCQECPGGEKEKLQDVITELCTLIDTQKELIASLTERVSQLEIFH